jgi:CRISPR-associated protein Csm2
MENLAKMINLDEYPIEEIIKDAETTAEDTTKIKTSQIRNFYSAILRIRLDYEKINKQWNEDIEIQIQMLKPKLAYAAGRQKEIKRFKIFVEKYIDALLNSKNKTKALDKFFLLIESYVAYHKYYGGN